MKTIPDLETEWEWAEETYNNRMINWNRPEADKFGTWYDWDDEDIAYLLQELAAGHWDDCGDTQRGFALATAALSIAQIANETAPGGDKVERILSDFAQGLAWFMDVDDYLGGDNALKVIEVAGKVIELIDSLRDIEAEKAEFRAQMQAIEMDNQTQHRPPQGLQ